MLSTTRLLTSLGLLLTSLACGCTGSIVYESGEGGAGGHNGTGASSTGGATSTTVTTGGSSTGGTTTTTTTTTTTITTTSVEGTAMVYVGTQDGKIRVLTLNKPTGALSLVQEVDAGTNPSFLTIAPNKKNLYSVDQSEGALHSYAIDAVTGELTPNGGAPSGGTGPTHIAVEATGQFVFTANMDSGNVRMITASPGGGYGAGVQDLPTGGWAHQVVFDASNKFAFVPNMADGTISQLVFGAAGFTLAYNSPASVSLPAGSGPRHMALHPNAPFAYVIQETAEAVSVFPLDAQKGTLGASIQTISTLPPGADGSGNTAAHVAFGPSGQHLYGSNRGHDSIVIYDVNAQTGMLTLVGHQPTGGSTPRHFAIEPSGEIMLVGNQGSSEVRTFRIDQNTGTLTELFTLPLPGPPACVAAIYL